MNNRMPRCASSTARYRRAGRAPACRSFYERRAAHARSTCPAGSTSRSSVAAWRTTAPPIWMRRPRRRTFPDYVGEERRSKYDLWWAFGWPYESAVAMARLLLSGLFDRHPNLKINRPSPGRHGAALRGNALAAGSDQLASKRTGRPGRRRRAGRRGETTRSTISECLYGDTPRALWSGAHPRLIRCGLEFFGVGARLVRHGCAVRIRQAIGLCAATIAAVDRIGVTSGRSADADLRLVQRATDCRD